MKSLRLPLLIALTLAGLAQPVAAQSGMPILEFTDLFRITDYPGQDLGLFAAADAAFLTRSNSQQVFLAQQKAGNVTINSLDTDDTSFSYQPGVYLHLGYRYDNYAMLEGSYLGLFNYNATSQITQRVVPGGTTTLTSSYLNNVGSNAATAINSSYDSTLHSGDINFRLFPSRTGSWWTTSTILGVRYVNLHENFTLSDTVVNAATQNVTSRENTSVAASNNLGVIQMGGDIGFCCERWSFWLYGKAGVGVNVARTSLNNNLNNLTRLTSTAEGTSFATMIEAGMMGSYQITNHILVRGGYQFIFISGVALAPEQLPPNINVFENTVINGNVNSSFLNVQSNANTRGNVLYHGPSVGVEVHW